MKTILSAFTFILISLNSIASDGGYLFVEGKTRNKTWNEYSNNERVNIKALLDKLAQSNVGRQIIEKAKERASAQGENLFEVIRPGEGSITDTTLTRKFTPARPEKISYESNSKVYINISLTRKDAVLDLAHELTHFVYREEFNPYKGNFTLEEFIESTVEGSGGEVHAFINECKIVKDLYPSEIKYRHNCRNILDYNTGKPSYIKAVKRFYKIGQYYSKFSKKLLNLGMVKSLKKIDEDGAKFISSAYAMPYPVAAYHEYVSVLKKVCDNDKRRLTYFKIKDRSPASTEFKVFQESYNKRCSDIARYDR